MNITELEYFKYENFDCLKFNGYNKDSAIFKPYRFQSADWVKYRLNLYLEASNNSLLTLYISDNYLKSLKKQTYINIKSQKRNLFYISKTIYKRLGEPYNDCKNINDKAYRQDNCIYQCIEENVFNKYNCSIRDYFRLISININISIRFQQDLIYNFI